MKKVAGHIFMLISMHIATSLYAQKVTEPGNNPTDWLKPYEPFRIAGNLYYTGTYDLASYLVVTGQGNIRINTGHTKGSCSYMLDVKDNNRIYKVLIANIPTIITERKFADVKEYPSVKEDYAYTLNAMKQLEFDIWGHLMPASSGCMRNIYPEILTTPMHLLAGKDMTGH